MKKINKMPKEIKSEEQVIDDRFLACPKLNNKGRYNIEVTKDGSTLLLGQRLSDVLGTFAYIEYDTEEKAQEHINNDKRLKLEKTII